MEILPLPGHYVIVAQAMTAFSIQKNGWLDLTFPDGFYFYCGSAGGPGGLAARIGRHLRANTKKFWHFDYIKPNLVIKEIWWQADNRNLECRTAQFLSNLPDAQIPAKGFGASDCKQGCPAHLIYMGITLNVADVLSALNHNGWSYCTSTPNG